MLMSVRLENFAVSEETELSFASGLTVLTGETGAGKSLIVDALGLLAGGRADCGVVRTGAEEAVVEGIFEAAPVLLNRLEALGLPASGDQVSIRRVVGASGRGRVHINGALTSVSILSRLMRGLIDIAGQHDHMSLLDGDHHVTLLDAFAGLTQAPASPDGSTSTSRSDRSGPAVDYHLAFDALKRAEASLASLGGTDAEVAAKMDFLKFQHDELERLNPHPEADSKLEEERRRLAGVVRLRELATAAEELLSNRDESAFELCTRALQALSSAQSIDQSASMLSQSLTTICAELDEAGRQVSRYVRMLEADPARLAEIEDRLDAIRRLSRKHNVAPDELAAKRDALADELKRLSERHRLREVAAADVEHARTRAEHCARRLTEARAAAATRFSQAVVTELEAMALKGVRFQVAFSAAPLSSRGADAVTFMFSANPGEALQPLNRAASGGELSRVMLATKAVLSAKDECLCSVFDEADSGVGGAVADAIGRLIKQVSAHRQVLCITHVPQVAAHGDAHWCVVKVERNGRARSAVKPLHTDDLRTRELARMMSGRAVTHEAIGAAQALVRAASRSSVLRSRKRNQLSKRNSPRP